MKKTITNREAVEIISGYAKMIRKEDGPRFPVRVMHNINKNMNKIEAELAAYNKTVGELNEQYTKKDKAGNVAYTNGGETELPKALSELLDCEVEVDVQQFSIDEMGNVTLDANEIRVLDIMIRD